MTEYQKPAHWANPANKLFPHQVGFTCPPHDFDAAPSDFPRMSPQTVGVHGRMLHLPDYVHQLDQRKQNLHLLEEFVECMANNGVDVCGQVGSNWVHASGLGVEGIRQHCEALTDKYETPFHMAGYAMVEALRERNVEKVALNAAYHHPSWWQGTVDFLKEAGFDVVWAGNFHSNLRASDGLKPQARSKYIDIGEAPDRVKAVYEKMLPHYEHMGGYRLQVS